ncbi:hypothetical protein C0J52_00453 [Blattella germanica]|nr:hypothetical protein C0J52_00453 [Blattella germanica]
MFQTKAIIHGKMKVLSVIALGVFALGVVTFKSVTSLPKLKPTPAPFDWTQFLPGGGAAAQKRAVVGSDPSSVTNGVYSAVPPNIPPNPMSPYLSLKPFLPVKPTMVPPFVDPNLFIGKKAELLSNLFGTGVGPGPASAPSFIPPWVSGGVISSPSFFDEKKTTLLGTTFDNTPTDAAYSSPDSKRALTEEEPSISAAPRLVGAPGLWGPPAGVIPAPKPTIVAPGYWSPFPAGAPAAGPVPPVVDPSVMIDKKTKFLSDLFNSISASPSTPGVSERALVPDTAPADATEKPTIVPPSYWLQFIPAFATPPPPPTEKPTIVPPGFWLPSISTKPVGIFGPPVPVVDPAQFADKKAAFLSTLFNTLNISVTPEPTTTPAPTLDPMAAYQEKVADFLDKLFDALVNNGTSDSIAAKRALDVATQAKTAEDLKAFLGEISTVEENAAKLENELDARSAFERRSADDTNATDATGPSQLPVDALLSAKDKVTSTIIAEMGGIKNNIMDTLAELLAKQKEAAATPPPTPAPKKKPGPPFGPGGPFGMGGPFGAWGAAAATTTTPKPTPDPEPFQKKVEFLGQVFDTLTQLEKDVTEALNQAVSEAAAVYAATAAPPATPPVPVTAPANPASAQIQPANPAIAQQNGTTLIELIRKKLVELANSTASSSQQVTQEVPKYARAIIPGKPMGPPFGVKPIPPFVAAKPLPVLPFAMGPPTPAPTIVDPSFWIPDPAAGIPGPDFYLGKTQAFLSKLFASKAAASATADDSDDDDTAANKARSIKMAVHQGYQSLPPGSEELLQAGGGSTPEKHEGGGLKFQENAPNKIPMFSEGGPNNHRHHNHHNRD